MGLMKLLTLLLFYTTLSQAAEDSLLTTLLTPTTQETDTKLQRKSRSYYYDPRYIPRPLYERLENERPNCGRCADHYDDRDDPYRYYDRPNRYDDDRRPNRYGDDRRPSTYDDDRRSRPGYGNKNEKDKNDNFDSRRTVSGKNGTKDEDHKQEDDRRSSPGGSRRGDRERPRYDDRRRRPEYDSRDPRDPRDPYYDDFYRERRPLYDRYPAYDAYDEGYAPKNDYDYAARRPAYDDRHYRGNGYDDTGYGGYGPGVGRGPHDSFRPWDETYRGQSGFDDGGRGYYFAGGRPDAGGGWGRREQGRLWPEYYREPMYEANYYEYERMPLYDWSRRGYTRPQPTSGWHDVNYPTGGGGGGGHRDIAYGLPQDGGYRYEEALGGYKPSGWHNVNDRRPYRDQSGQNDYRGQQHPSQQNYNNQQNYNSNNQQQDRNNNEQLSNNGQNNPSTSSTTPGTSYLYEREDTQHISQDMKDEATTVKN